MFIVAAICIGLDGARLTARANDGFGWPRAVLLTWAALVVVLNYGTLNGRSEGPSWPHQVKLARTTCLSSSTATVQIPISPARWVVEVPCRDLR
jgi:hypothetical protein